MEKETKYEIWTKKNGRAEHVSNISELEDHDLIAKVKVIFKNGKEMSRDMFIKNEDWITVEDYYKTNAI